MASPTPDPEVQTEDHHAVDDISYQIWIGTIVTVVSATIAVVLRFISRHISKAGFWWDDWVIVASLIVNWAMAITRWIQIIEFNFGKHGEDIPRGDVVAYQKSFIAIQLIYFTNAVLTKSSLLLLYHRIFGIVRTFNYFLFLSWFLVISYFIACVIASIAGCSPVSYIWERFRPGESAQGSCFNEIAFFRWNGIANMFLDILMLVLPLPMVWRVKTSRRVKVLLTGVFAMGGFVCVVSLLRIISFNYSDRGDPTYTQIHSSMWSSVEQGVGIVCACLPTFRHLRRLWSKSGSGSGSFRSSGRSSGRSSKRSSCQSGSGSEGLGNREAQESELEMGVERGERRWADRMFDPVGVYGGEELLKSIDDVLDWGGRSRAGSRSRSRRGSRRGSSLWRGLGEEGDSKGEKS